MSNSYTFGDLKIITNATIDTTGSFATIQCCPSEMSMSYGFPKILHIPGKGSWTHTVFIWFGKLTDSLTIFTNSLPKSSKIYTNGDVSLWLLKSDQVVGNLEVSCYVTPQGILRIKNNLGHPLLKSLDKAYNIYRSSFSVDYAIKALLGLDRNIDITSTTKEGEQTRATIYNKITEPFSLDLDAEVKRYEDALALSFDITRKQHVRELMQKIYTRACEIEKHYGH